MRDNGTEIDPHTAAVPERRVRIAGQAICAAVAECPWVWPLIRRAVASYFDKRAPGWEERTGSGSPDQLAPLARGVLVAGADPEAILDLGCGAGSGTLFLAREYPSARVRGIDISEEMVRQAQSRIGLDPEGRVAFRQADACSLPYPEDSFDLLTQTNLPVFAGELARVARKGAFLVVASSLGSATPFHTGRARLRRVLARHGFEEVATGAAGSGTFYVARMREAS